MSNESRARIDSERMGKLQTQQRIGLCLLVLVATHWGNYSRGDTVGSATLSSQNRPRLVAQLGHSGSVETVAFSPDGRWVLTGGMDGTARLWDVTAGAELRQFAGHTGAVTSVAFSPDGRWVLTGSWDRTARLWDVATGAELRRFTGHAHWVRAVTFSPDGRRVLTGSRDRTVRLWDATTGAELRQFTGHTGTLTSVAFSPDGRWVLTGGVDGTARLWDVTAGAELRQFAGHTGAVTSVAFSPDGRRVLTGSRDRTVRLWDATTGAELRQFTGHTGTLTSVAFSPDGRRVLTAGSTDQAARLWDVTTGAEVRRFTGHVGGVDSVAFSPDGRRVLTGSWDRTVRLWDTTTGAELRQFTGHTNSVVSVTFSPDGHWVLTARTRTVRLWDVTTGAELLLEGQADWTPPVAFSPDGRWMLTGRSHDDDRTARLWDVTTGAEVRRFIRHADFVTSVAFSPDGRLVLTGSADRTARLWDATTGAKLRQFTGHTDKVTSVAFSPDGRRVLTASNDRTARLWDVTTGAELRQFAGYAGVTSVAFSPDGRFVLTGDERFDITNGTELGTARLWDITTGAELRQFTSRGVTSVAFSPDGRWVLTGSMDGTARLWDITTGTELRQFTGHTGWVTSVAFSPDGRWVLTGSLEGTARLWRVATGQELCRLVSFDDGTWAVVDPQGRYDAGSLLSAANGGEVAGLHWVVGNEPIALAQLKERYYEPGLLAKLLGFNKEPLRDVSAFTEVKLFPAVQYEVPAPGSTRLTLTLTNRGGGIGKVRVLLNGKEVAADARGPQLDPQAARATLTLDLAESPTLRPGVSNTIEVVAWNAEGYLSSRGARSLWTPAGSATASPTDVYAIVGGISDYASPTLTLRFAAKDAQDMATALALGAKRLFGADHVHLTLLGTVGKNPDARPPTKANFRTAFAEARKAKPTDILVVYLAGHGVTLPGSEDTYAYPTQEARSTDLSDPAVRAQAAITSEELTEWIKQIRAQKQVMILDTCAAGAAAAKLVEQRNVSSSQIRALERLKDRTGFHVLMGSAADKVSYEASRYEQGLLTYALLQGIRGAALREDTYVDVSRLFQHAANQVPDLARDVGGVQRPHYVAPQGADSFDIGQLEQADKAAIPLRLPQPLLLRPRLLNPEVVDDNLQLEPAVRQRLSEQSYAAVRGTAPPLGGVYVDAEEFPGAIRPNGTYTVVGQTVQVKLVLVRDGQRVASAQVEGAKEDPAGVAVKIVEAITQTMRALAE